MKFEEHCYYEHKEMQDVFVKVYFSQPMNERHFLLVSWWNKGQMEKPFSLGVQQIIEIKKPDYKNWVNCDWRVSE